MISRLRGIVIEASSVAAIIEAGGVGYEVQLPVSTAEKLPPVGQEAILHTLLVVREDAQTLYGFSNTSERAFFRLLTVKVSGVGPRIALNLMSRLSLPSLQSAIASGDVALLAKCPGIGKKTAERLVVELRDKLDGLAVVTPTSATPLTTSSTSVSAHADAVNALLALGYKATEADKAVSRASKSLGKEAQTEELIRMALRQ